VTNPVLVWIVALDQQNQATKTPSISILGTVLAAYLAALVGPSKIKKILGIGLKISWAHPEGVIPRAGALQPAEGSRAQ